MCFGVLSSSAIVKGMEKKLAIFVALISRSPLLAVHSKFNSQSDTVYEKQHFGRDDRDN